MDLVITFGKIFLNCSCKIKKKKQKKKRKKKKRKEKKKKRKKRKTKTKIKTRKKLFPWVTMRMTLQLYETSSNKRHFITDVKTCHR